MKMGAGHKAEPENAMPSSKKKSQIPADKFELYEKLIATSPEIARKGDVHPYTSVNGHMFTYLD